MGRNRKIADFALFPDGPPQERSKVVLVLVLDGCSALDDLEFEDEDEDEKEDEAKKETLESSCGPPMPFPYCS